MKELVQRVYHSSPATSKPKRRRSTLYLRRASESGAGAPTNVAGRNQEEKRAVRR
ncbi:hypothetical protein [Salipaludibacillus aurantiacus]|uniref:hypothetical protein n=1 Tax=Salipaludibacillus aurantiacus TaxID=1601833 RepID=UPI0015A5D26E|nr:hypothetical protein [Salipaludibacillus aurantiacus]